MSCKGLHCPGCGDSGGSGVLAVIVALVVIGAITGPAIARAARDVLHIVVLVAEIGGITIGAAALITGTALGVRHARRRAGPDSHRARNVTAAVLPRRYPAVTPPVRQALPAPELHLHLHGPDAAAQAAAIITRHHNQIQE